MQRRGFTLVELLIVIAVISIIAALLMPVLRDALRTARRVACMAQRKQNYLQIQQYADDHGGRLMYHENGYPNTQDAAELAYGTLRIHGLGSLSTGGYVSDPALLFCPDFERAKKTFRPLLYLEDYFFDKPDFIRKCMAAKKVPWKSTEETLIDNNMPTYWDRIVANGRSSVDRGWTGISIYLRAWWDANRNGTRDADEEFWGHQMRLTDIADHWQDQPAWNYTPWGYATSPMILSCADYGSNLEGGAHLLSDPTAGHSHEKQGVNGIFFDGSGRWLSIAETRGNLRNSYLGDVHCDLQKFARNYLTLHRP